MFFLSHLPASPLPPLLSLAGKAPWPVLNEFVAISTHAWPLIEIPSLASLSHVTHKLYTSGSLGLRQGAFRREVPRLRVHIVASGIPKTEAHGVGGYQNWDGSSLGTSLWLGLETGRSKFSSSLNPWEMPTCGTPHNHSGTSKLSCYCYNDE